MVLQAAALVIRAASAVPRSGEKLAYEIDFLPVGDGERSGDAIAMRYVINGRSYVHVVDGGTTESGDALCDHILINYGTDRVDFASLSHGDDDHSSGLRRVIERMDVGQIYMNRPWLHAAHTIDAFEANWTVERLAKQLRRCFPIMTEIEYIAYERGIPIFNAFAGTRIGAFIVLAPTLGAYQALVPLFSRTPVEASGLVSALDLYISPSPRLTRAGIASALAEQTRQWIAENWTTETLSENAPGDDASNESSLVLLGIIDGHGLLLTGDANARALHRAADFAEQVVQMRLPRLSLVQIPHHGSRRNVSPSSLNRWLGAPLLLPGDPTFTAVASAAAGSTKHPRQKVVNAFIRRGARVLSTQGKVICSYYGFERRHGWVTADALPFSTRVEA